MSTTSHLQLKLKMAGMSDAISPGSMGAEQSSSSDMALLLATLLKRLIRASPSSGSCSCSPEAGVGILSAVTSGSANHMRVVHQTRADARGITLATSLSLCIGHHCSAAPRCRHLMLFRPAEFLLSCGLCRRWIGGSPIYIYKGEMGFCKPECRDDYIVQELNGKRANKTQKTPMVDDGCMFFTCTNNL